MLCNWLELLQLPDTTTSVFICAAEAGSQAAKINTAHLSDTKLRIVIIKKMKFCFKINVVTVKGRK